MKEGQTQEPVGGMKDQCSHEWVGYNQCCYCGAMKNHKGEILPMTTHPQYPVKKLAEDFEEWYFGIKNDTGKSPLAMQIFYWFSQHLNLFDELTKPTPPPAQEYIGEVKTYSPIKTEGEDEARNIIKKLMIDFERICRGYTGFKADSFSPYEEAKNYIEKEVAPPSPGGIDELLKALEYIATAKASDLRWAIGRIQETAQTALSNFKAGHSATLPQSNTNNYEKVISETPQSVKDEVEKHFNELESSTEEENELWDDVIDLVHEYDINKMGRNEFISNLLLNYKIAKR